MVALAAQRIAERCDGLNPEAAYMMGLLHDIGRRNGFSYIKHTLDGYRYLCEQGFEEIAPISLTHSFPLQDISAFVSSDRDVTDADYYFIERFVMERTYDEYDRLIQLCDSLGLGGGGILIEKRLVDVAMRYGVNEYTIEKWRVIFGLKKHFDDWADINVYRLLPNIVDNTFEW